MAYQRITDTFMNTNPKTPCRGDEGEVVCERADLPFCRVCCEEYAEYERKRLDSYKSRHITEVRAYKAERRKK